jgi:hypothetical protein
MSEVRPYKIVTSIAKLSLDRFIDGFVDHDYSGLVIEGEAPEPIIQLTWNDIVDQYNDAISRGDESQKQYISAYQEYLRSKSRHDIAISYIELLNVYFVDKGIVVKKWIKQLNRLCDARYSYNPEKPEDFIPYLETCFNRNKSNLIRYRMAEVQLSELLKLEQPKKENTALDRAYFIQVMLNLKNMEGREIPFSISTLEFCLLVNRYRDYIKELNKAKNRR